MAGGLEHQAIDTKLQQRISEIEIRNKRKRWGVVAWAFIAIAIGLGFLSMLMALFEYRLVFEKLRLAERSVSAEAAVLQEALDDISDEIDAGNLVLSFAVSESMISYRSLEEGAVVDVLLINSSDERPELGLIATGIEVVGIQEPTSEIRREDGLRLGPRFTEASQNDQYLILTVTGGQNSLAEIVRNYALGDLTVSAITDEVGEVAVAGERIDDEHMVSEGDERCFISERRGTQIVRIEVECP